MKYLKKDKIFILWLVSIVYFCFISFLSLSNNFIVHSFRQAQTALTTIFLKEEGFKLAYATPFMGYPWSVPMEIPLFQWVVYLFSLVSDFHFVKIGKTINILFHVLNNFLILGISNKLRLQNRAFYLGLLFYNIIPFYLTYDNTFLIDPMSLSLSFAAIYFLINFWSQSNSFIFFSLCFVSLLLTGLTKITTFISILTPLFFISLFLISKEKYQISIRVIKEKKVYFVLSLWLIAFVFSLLWTYYADSIKGQNPLSVNWQSQNLKTWNFGTIEQRLSFKNWYKLITFSMVMHPVVLIATAIALFYSLIFSSGKSNLYLLVYATLYLLPPLLFFNLFLVHTYYSIINLLFLCFFYAQLIINISTHDKRVNFRRLYLVTIFSILFFLYRSWVFSSQIFKQGKEPGIWGQLDKIDFLPDKNDAILVIDPSQDPFLEYHFRCRGINLSEENFIKLDLAHKLNDLIGKQQVNLVCITGSESLVDLPKAYMKYLTKYTFTKSLYDNQNNTYYNFFWN